MAQRTFSFKQYRAADLTIFLLILCALEAVIQSLARQWVNTLYVVSLFYAVVAIVLMRWGCWAALHCFAAAVVQCVVAVVFEEQTGVSVDWAHWASYIVGDCCALLAMLFLHFVGKQKTRDSFGLTLLFVVIVYVAVNLGRGGMLSLTKAQPFFSIVSQCLATESLSAIIAAVIVLIARKQNGLFEDQKHYLLRTEEERREELKNKPPEM